MVLSILISVIVVSLIGAGLAAIASISEYFFCDYGECEITINDEQNLNVQGGQNVLSYLTEEKIFIPSACGGRGTCGLCKLKILEGAGPLLPTEEPYLEKNEIESNVRLSCQVKVRNDLKIEIPEELFSVREYICRCEEIIDLTYNIKQFRFKLIEPDIIDFKAGQYVQLLTPVYEKSSEEVYRAYSVSSNPADKNAVELIIKLVPGGICTTYCFEYMKLGDEININGPYGDFVLADSQSPIIFIAGGSGMAPVKSMLHYLSDTGSRRDILYYFGANKTEDLFLLDLMKDFEKEINSFRFVPVVSHAEDGTKKGRRLGLVTDAVQKDLADASKYEAYLCGSPGMVDATEKILIDHGIHPENIFYDKYES
jgi:Na+-transporting NADH:ubiquinone oxidoreductase subunit F